MGYPKLINWLKYQQKKYNIFFETLKIPNNIQTICINLNNIVYNIYDNINNKQVENIEDLIIDNTIVYLNNIINKYKTKYFFITLDGIPPYNKLNQQRIKRYNLFFKNNKDIETKINKWNASYNILPGTEFIKKLDIKLCEFINNNKNIKIYYSSYKKYGEGVHKIIQYIKRYIHNNNNVLIYGCDSDITLLSLINSIVYNNNIYIFNGYNDKVKYYNINEMKKILMNLFKSLTNMANFIVIYLFINFHQIPFYESINLIVNMINDNSNLDLLYQENDVFKINNKILLHFIEELKNKEIILFKNYDNLMSKEYFDILKTNPKLNINMLNEIDSIREKQNDYNKFSIINLKDKNNNEIKTIMNTYKNKYYNYYNIKIINEICKDYFYGFYWLFNYYFNCELNEKLCATNPDNIWYYKYYCAPFINNLFNYYKEHNEEYDEVYFMSEDNTINFNEQLSYIIPYTHLNDFLIEKINGNKNLIIEKEFFIDTLHKINTYDCVYIIPLIDYNVLKNIVK